MSTPEHWQRPVELSPDALETGTATANHNEAATQKAREVPLASTHAVDDEIEELDLPIAPAKPRRSRRWLWGTLITLVVAAVCAELYRLISWSSDIHPLLGGLFALLSLILVVILLMEARRGLEGSRQLKQAQTLQQQAQRLIEQQSHGQSGGFTTRLEKTYQQTPLARELGAAVQQLDSQYNDAEIVRYLDHQALRRADKAAQQCVQRYSIESGVLVAFSPWAGFDMLLVAWRNLRMLREIGAIYGLSSGWLTQGKLLKQVLNNLAFAGAGEIAMDAGSAFLSSSLTAGLSARAGQGLAAGLFTARTGFSAIECCRPLPDTGDKQKRSRKIASLILQRLGKGKETNA